MISLFKKKEVPKDVTCNCGHGIMLHGFSNMGCSVMIKDESGNDKKCPCPKFQKSV
jgi:hypothetical protein